MQKKLPFTVTPTSISIFLDGHMRTIPASHTNFKRIDKALRDLHTAEETDDNNSGFISRLWHGRRTVRIERVMNRIRALIDVPKYVAKVTEGDVVITEHGVLYKGSLLQSAAAERIMALVKSGHDVRPLMKFIQRLDTNPDKDVAHDLFLWMERAQMPLTPEGKFLAFKKVAGDYASIHRGPDGPIYNHVGTTLKMEREDVDNNRSQTCSRGLHFCGYEYLGHYGTGGENRVVVLEIAPEDVCAIPTDYQHQKGRAWRYDIVGEVPQHEVAHFFRGTPLVKGGTIAPIEATVADDWEMDDWDEYPEDYDDETGAVSEFGRKDDGDIRWV